MKLSVPSLSKVFHRSNSYTTVSPKHTVILHWIFLLLFGVVLLLIVVALGFFLHSSFVTGKEGGVESGEIKTLFDEKKLKQVIERMEKKKENLMTAGTSTTVFVDPSIPI